MKNIQLCSVLSAVALGLALPAAGRDEHGSQGRVSSGGGRAAVVARPSGGSHFSTSNRAAFVPRSSGAFVTSRSRGAVATSPRAFAFTNPNTRAWRGDRDWDRDWWRRHHHHHDRDFVIIDGVPFFYPFYDYGPYPYAYDYGYSAPAPAYDYAAPGGSVAAEVQRELADEGYYHGPIDGLIGPMTRSAIAGYQRDHDLTITGTLNNSLLRSMGL
jgi:putative peptidoglycan binding protein